MKNSKFGFTRLSMYTAYTIGLAAALMFFWTRDPQVLKVAPLAKFFVDTAQISTKVSNNKENTRQKN